MQYRWIEVAGRPASRQGVRPLAADGLAHPVACEGVAWCQNDRPVPVEPHDRKGHGLVLVVNHVVGVPPGPRLHDGPGRLPQPALITNLAFAFLLPRKIGATAVILDLQSFCTEMLEQ